MQSSIAGAGPLNVIEGSRDDNGPAKSEIHVLALPPHGLSASPAELSRSVEDSAELGQPVERYFSTHPVGFSCILQVPWSSRTHMRKQYVSWRLGLLDQICFCHGIIGSSSYTTKDKVVRHG